MSSVKKSNCPCCGAVAHENRGKRGFQSSYDCDIEQWQMVTQTCTIVCTGCGLSISCSSTALHAGIKNKENSEENTYDYVKNIAINRWNLRQNK